MNKIDQSNDIKTLTRNMFDNYEVWDEGITYFCIDEQNIKPQRYGYVADMIFSINDKLIDEIKKNYNVDVSPYKGYWIAYNVICHQTWGYDSETIHELYKVEKREKTILSWEKV